MLVNDIEAYKDSLLSVFLQSVIKYPEKPALHISSQSYSFQELYYRARSIAEWVPDQTDCCCAIYAERHFNAFASIIASLLVYRAFVPLSLKLPVERNLDMLSRSKADIVLVDASGEVNIKLILSKLINGITVIFLERFDLPLWTAEFPQHHFITIKPKRSHSSFRKMTGSLCYLMFTSGSTGTPKGVMIEHKSILVYIHSMLKRLNTSSEDHFSQVADLTFDVSIHEIFVSFAAGGCLYVINDFHMMRLSKCIVIYRLTYLTFVPSVVILMTQLEPLPANYFPLVKYTLFGGEVLTTSLVRLWRRLAPNTIIENHYGPTEATIGFAVFRVNRMFLHHGIVPIGQPLPGQSIAIVDAELNQVKNDVVGELYLTGSQIAKGYWCDEQLTRQCFVHLLKVDAGKHIWYRTGDLAKLNKDNVLEFIGRFDGQLQVRGCRVERKEVEIKLKNLAQTEEVAVIPGRLDSGGNILNLLAFIAGSHLSEREILIQSSAKLPDVMRPQKIIKLDGLPLNNNGKIDYRALEVMRDALNKREFQ